MQELLRGKQGCFQTGNEVLEQWLCLLQAANRV